MASGGNEEDEAQERRVKNMQALLKWTASMETPEGEIPLPHCSSPCTFTLSFASVCSSNHFHWLHDELCFALLFDRACGCKRELNDTSACIHVHFIEHMCHAFVFLRRRCTPSCPFQSTRVSYTPARMCMHPFNSAAQNRIPTCLAAPTAPLRPRR